MGKIFEGKRSIIISVIIFLLVAAIITLCIVLNVKTSNLSKKSEELKKANDTISEYSSKEAEAKKEKSKMQSEIDSITAENESLKKQMTELAAKKEAARQAALEKENAERKKLEEQARAAQIERTNKIIATLSLPKTQQASMLPNVCYLTFDDGPTSNTPQILDILKRYNVKATFFVIGNNNLSILPLIASEGHTIGLHANNHNYAVIYSSLEAYLSDLKAISDKVKAITGITSSVVRFPGGGSNLVSAKHCVGIMTQLSVLLPDMGYSYFDWNVDSGDANGNCVPANVIINNTLSGTNGKPSICVLMHDATSKTTTVQALPAIIENLALRGYRFEAITPQTNGYHHPIKN